MTNFVRVRFWVSLILRKLSRNNVIELPLLSEHLTTVFLILTALNNENYFIENVIPALAGVVMTISLMVNFLACILFSERIF